MDEITTAQGQEITKDDIGLVQRLIEANPSWNRTRLSKELCLLWNWHAANGQIKDMACRTLLLKLEQRGHITLPGHRSPGRGYRIVFSYPIYFQDLHDSLFYRWWIKVFLALGYSHGDHCFAHL